MAGTFQQILTKAKTYRKPIFIEVYLTGCPHCEALVPILAEKKVGDFFNANFVNWKIEANSDASKKLQRDKGITYPEFPLFLFLDTNGTLIHMATPGERSSKADFMQAVLQQGEDALNPKQRTASYGARFQAGDRDLGFLLNFGKYCKVIKDTARLRHVNDALGQVLVQPQDRLSQAGFYAVQRLIDDVDNPLAIYFFSHLPAFTATYSEKVVKEAGEGLLFRALYGSKSNLYSAARIVQMRDHMVALGVPVSEAAARTLLNELDAHLRERNTVAATQRFNEYRKQIPTVSLADYAYLMHYFNEKATDTSYLVQMPVWAAEGLALAAPDQRKGQQVADLYYELAVAYQKMGNKAEALRSAQQGMSIAKEANIDTKRYEKQLERMR